MRPEVVLVTPGGNPHEGSASASFAARFPFPLAFPFSIFSTLMTYSRALWPCTIDFGPLIVLALILLCFRARKVPTYSPIDVYIDAFFFAQDYF